MNLDIIGRLVQILRASPELGAIEVRRGWLGAWTAVRVSRAGHPSNPSGGGPEHVVVAAGGGGAPPPPPPSSPAARNPVPDGGDVLFRPRAGGGAVRESRHPGVARD